jgi:membrane fusion protein (multidrug efflux system)
MAEQQVETQEERRPVSTGEEPDLNHENGGEGVGKKPGLFERKPYLRVVTGLVLLIFIAVAILFWLHARAWEDTDDAQVDGHISNVSARISGHIAKIYYDDNQIVQAGAVLAEIDPSDYQVALQRAQADYKDLLAQAEAAKLGVPVQRTSATTTIASAQADVASAQATLAAAEKQADAARAQLAQAEANAVKANNDVKRYEQLVQKQEISQQQFDAAVAAAKSSNAAVTAAEATVHAADQQINVAKSRLLQSRANLQQARTQPINTQAITHRASAAGSSAQKAQADMNQAQLNLNYTKIIAPVTGIVGHRSVEVGQNVSPGQMLMSVVPLDALWVTANFKETQLHYMRPGQRVKIHVDAIDKDIEGTVDSLGAATGAVFSLLPPENATGNYVKVVQRVPVKITYKHDQDPEQRLRPGMSTEANVNVR